MKTLHYTKQHSATQLNDELAQMPSLAPTQFIQGRPVSPFTLSSSGQDIWLSVPDDADEGAIAKVVAAHVDNSAQREQARAQLQGALKQGAQLAVGKRFDQLTPNDIRAITAMMLDRWGVLDGEGKVRPLGEWPG